MNKNVLLITVVAIIAVAVGGFALVKSQKASQTPGQKEMMTGATPATDESPLVPSGQPAGKSNTTAMLTKIEQITLTVSSPLNNSTVTSSKVTVKGKTLAKAEVYANEAEGVADGSGNFSLSVTLDDGDNEILVTAVDADGNVAETVVAVSYNAGE